MMEDCGSIRLSSVTSSPSRKRRLSPAEINFAHSSSKSPSPDTHSVQRSISTPGSSNPSITNHTHSNNTTNRMINTRPDGAKTNNHSSGSTTTGNNTDSRNSAAEMLWGRTFPSMPRNTTSNNPSAHDSQSGTIDASGSFRFSSITGTKSARLQQNYQSMEYSTNNNNGTSSTLIRTDRKDSLSSDPSGNFSLGSKKMNNPPNSSTSLRRRNGTLEIQESEEQAQQLDMIDEDHCSMDTDNQLLDGWHSLHQNVTRLASILEDVQGQYPELEALEMHLTCLERMIQVSGFKNLGRMKM